MIPPVEERQVRPCIDCIFIDYGIDGKKNDSICECIFGFSRWKKSPCKSNFTDKELLELIDQYNMLEARTKNHDHNKSVKFEHNDALSEYNLHLTDLESYGLFFTFLVGSAVLKGDQKEIIETINFSSIMIGLHQYMNDSRDWGTGLCSVAEKFVFLFSEYTDKIQMREAEP